MALSGGGERERELSRNDQFIEFSLAFLDHRDNRILNNRLEVWCFTVKSYCCFVVVLLVKNDDAIVFCGARDLITLASRLVGLDERSHFRRAERARPRFFRL